MAVHCLLTPPFPSIHSQSPFSLIPPSTGDSKAAEGIFAVRTASPPEVGDQSGTGVAVVESYSEDKEEGVEPTMEAPGGDVE